MTGRRYEVWFNGKWRRYSKEGPRAEGQGKKDKIVACVEQRETRVKNYSGVNEGKRVENLALPPIERVDYRCRAEFIRPTAVILTIGNKEVILSSSIGRMNSTLQCC